MKGLILKEGYSSALSLRETQRAIKFVKDTFQVELASALKLERISAPLFVESGKGINDDLNGIERKVTFDIKEAGCSAEVVQSLAKWKRTALSRYGFEVGKGLYTDMCAIRRDDDMDNLHSIYVDQWDWERVIEEKDRNFDFLRHIVKKIVGAIVITKEKVVYRYPELKYDIEPEIFFVSSQALEDMYPDLSPKQREYEIVKEKRTVFITEIGKTLKSGKRHDGRAPDYDDWDLNGDLLFWNDVLESPIEISSMGIRVNAESLKKQLEIANATDRLKFDYHKQIVKGELPLTIGGGIGQSRLCLLLLEKLHVGEVQASIWPKDQIKKCEKHGINLL